MRAAFIVATALILGLGVQTPAMAQSRTGHEDASHTGGIGLPVGGAQILRFDRPVGRVYLGNSEVADVIALTDRSIYLLGKEAGTSSLTIMERGERAVPLATYTVQVGVDALGLRRTLHDVMPDEEVEVRLAGDGLVLSGAVSSSAAADRATLIAQRFAADRVVNSMTISAAEQVMLEVRVSEVQRNELTAMGLSTNVLWQNGADAAQLLSGVINPDAFGLLAGSVVSGDYTIDAVLDALERRGVVTTLARPTLVALSGETANFFAGGEFPIPVAADDDEDSRRITIEFKQFGVSVAFTPTVVGDTINLHVAPEVSALDRNNGIRLNGTDIPAITTRRAQTTVELRDGQSFAIAGLIRRDFTDSVSGLPGVSRMPILGALFRSTRFERQETEVVIIVTAHRAHPTTLDRLVTPTDLFNAPSQFQLFWGGQVEAPSRTQAINANAQTQNQIVGRFDQDVGYVVQ
ncbi:type II and III secretion system protein family protein [Terricaulis silvestris]|uniref:General secretion pathway protein D n=1 Tax=Terricaulis silvestris TaxID=2686094 RepID=A0A6I6MY72_9CAUL|nr:type II and III secretion system protein family protein [Terricaulis silvestris]QGZ96592.1 Putative general secretion pathway protein D [Terricaulis silvestris]